MKTIIRRLSALLSLLLLLPALSCTHNDGDIGELFGYWSLQSMTEDGHEVPLYSPDGTLRYVMAFQQEVVLIQQILPHSDYNRTFGSWHRDGSTLILNFDHTDQDDPTKYIPPTALRFDPSGITTFTMTKFTNSRLTLEYTDPRGAKLTYYFHKTR